MKLGSKKFKLVVCGGTFDHFHKGHEMFLRHVFSVGKKAVIGLTSDSYIKNNKIEDGILSFKERKQELISFLKSKSFLTRSIIVPIDNLYGPTLQSKFPIEAIIVSKETKKGAEKINLKRKALGLFPLKIIIASFIKGKDGKIISSLSIRRGIIDREGKLYIKPAWFSHRLQLTEELRTLLKKPFGELLKDGKGIKIDKSSFIITVGDVTTKLFNDLMLNQNISIVDFFVKRQKQFNNLSELGFSGEETVIYANNPASFLTPSLFSAGVKAFDQVFQKKRVIIQVNGEEDLSVLPLSLAAPLGTIIYYGQPNQGMVEIIVTEVVKKRVYEIVRGFKA